MPPHVPESPGGGASDERPSAAARDAEVNLGGADAVQKTSALGARAGTDPNETREVHAAIPAGRGFGAVGWVAIVLLLAVLLFYLSGLF